MNGKIIGVAGAAGAGKDQVAEFLVKDHRFVRVALADPIKRMVRDAQLWPFTDDQFWGSSERRGEPPPGMTGPPLRAVLQLLGTEWGRALDEDVWVRRALKDARRLLNVGGLIYYPGTGIYEQPGGYGDTVHYPGVVIPDVRFENEATAIREAGGEIWQVIRPDVSKDVVGGVPEHASEAGLSADFIDHAILNTGGLDQLRAAVQSALGPRNMGWERSVL